MITFLHWRYERAILQKLVPDGLQVQDYDGSAWVSVIALQMRDVRLPGTRFAPRLNAFAQTNLRTYVTGPDGKPGVWFLSVDAASALVVLGARLMLGAPYYLADLSISRGDGVRYAGTRAGRVRAGYDVHVRPGAALAATAKDGWLTNRWLAYTKHAGRLLELPVRHHAWSLREADLADLRQSVTTAAGLPVPGDEPLVRYCDEVPDATFAMPRLARH